MSKKNVFKCKIEGCESKNIDSISMFKVPTEQNMRKKWIQSIEKNQSFDYLCGSYRICELHFNKSDILERGHRIDLKPGSIPTIFRKTK